MKGWARRLPLVGRNALGRRRGICRARTERYIRGVSAGERSVRGNDEGTAQTPFACRGRHLKITVYSDTVEVARLETAVAFPAHADPVALARLVATGLGLVIHDEIEAGL